MVGAIGVRMPKLDPGLGYGRAFPCKCRKFISDAGKASQSLMALIGNILDFSKIEAGKLAIETGEVPVAAQAVEIMHSRARLKGLHITCVKGPDVPVIVRGDSARLRQILLNLIGNAIKFTKHGFVTIVLVVNSWDGDDCILEFLVIDSGQGFIQANAAKLFEPFVQGYEANADEDEGGTGLGLPI